MEFGIFLTLIVLGYFFGYAAEKSHYRSIFKREEKYNDLLTFSTKSPEQAIINHTKNVSLVVGSTVISIDYFKRFIASLRNFFGGNMTTYETLLDRGRREAILRMKEDAARRGANMIFNVKIETASISKGQRDASVSSIEVYAYGTALIVSK